ncbi:LITAF-like zinc ribbon domain-containing protein [Brevibacillus centrosporus]|uniref:LITAF-like zinc ribbon domain-containing protein n=1 Tax=Brevibacillus centrosporus TaxID=54910 RepID=UPI00399C4F73
MSISTQRAQVSLSHFVRSLTMLHLYWIGILFIPICTKSYQQPMHKCPLCA